MTPKQETKVRLDFKNRGEIYTWSSEGGGFYIEATAPTSGECVSKLLVFCSQILEELSKGVKNDSKS